MSRFSDRTFERTTFTGLGDVTLLGPVLDYISFFSAFGVGVPFYYVIVHPFIDEWEVGSSTGLVDTEGNYSFPRSTVITSSNAGLATDFTEGTKEVRCTLPASVTDRFVSGPTSVADNSLSRFDGVTGRLLQTSGWSLDDNDKMREVSSYSDIITVPASAPDFNLNLGHTYFMLLDSTSTSSSTVRPVADSSNNENAFDYPSTATQWSKVDDPVDSPDTSDYVSMSLPTLGQGGAGHVVLGPFPSQATSLLVRIYAQAITAEYCGLVGAYLYNATGGQVAWFSDNITVTSSAAVYELPLNINSTAIYSEMCELVLDFNCWDRAGSVRVYAIEIVVDAADSPSPTLTVSNIDVGQKFSIRFQQGVAGGGQVTWWPGITWTAVGAPVLSGSPGGVDWVEIICTAADTYEGFSVYTRKQNLFERISVSGQSTVIADNPSDALTLVAGDGVIITTDTALDSITISAVAGSGTLLGPDSSIDNSAAVFSGTTGKLLRSSPTVIYHPVASGAADKVELGATFQAWTTAADGATVVFDLDLSDKHTVTEAGNRLLSATNVSVGQRITLQRNQDVTGGRVDTWFANISWDNGLAPVQDPTSVGYDLVVLDCIGIDSYSVPQWVEVCRTSSAPRKGITSAIDGATVTFDLRKSPKQTVVLGGNRTLELTASSFYVGMTFAIGLIQDGTGSRTVTWGTSFGTINWLTTGGTEPVQPTAGGSVCWLCFVCRTEGGSPVFDCLGITGQSAGTVAADNRLGVDWVGRPVAQNKWYAICYGNGLFVAVADSRDISNPYSVMTSPDGVNWKYYAGSEPLYWRGVTYGNGLFVAVGDYGASGSRVMTSVDGETWIARASGGGSAVCYGNGLFVATAGSGAKTSPDGVTWTSRTTPISGLSICYGNGMFVIVGSSGTTGFSATSPTGTTWTARTMPSIRYWTSVCYGNGLFVAVSTGGTDGVATSPDGVTWTARTAPGNNWASVSYGGGLFVAVNGSTHAMTSSDGILWVSRPDTLYHDPVWTAVCYGPSMFVAVSHFNGSNAVMTSGSSDRSDSIIEYTGTGGNVLATGATLVDPVLNALRLQEGANLTMGVSTLVSGVATVSTSKVGASSRIMLSINGAGVVANLGVIYEDLGSRVPGTSFTIKCVNLLATPTVAWLIVEPA